MGMGVSRGLRGARLVGGWVRGVGRRRVVGVRGGIV